MRCAVAVLALSVLCWTLVSPLGAAVWEEDRLACGCSPDACYCPHTGKPLRSHESSRGHEHHADPASHGPESHEVAGHGSAHPTHSDPADHARDDGHGRSESGASCELRSCGSGPASGMGVIPTLPHGEMPSFLTVSGPVPSGSLNVAPAPHPPDVFRGVELPPPKR